MSEACTGEIIDPVMLQHEAEKEAEQEGAQLIQTDGPVASHMHRPRRHADGNPNQDHGRDEGEQYHPEVRQGSTVLCRQIGQILGELAKPIDCSGAGIHRSLSRGIQG
jgi:hypothetical protein